MAIAEQCLVGVRVRLDLLREGRPLALTVVSAELSD